ncbi:MAG: CDP-alcohol phosphatidyltransferase family protein, partial [Streptomyces sp.]|nr:CDP-alcohol phosphatidyltransferase family protein [Streptomyces sp.]NUS23292.1 CDP-alcohol phosphatidyltransferase family protein [Streptomyces sp.]
MSTAILTGQPVPGSSIEGDLRSLGFDVRTASDAAETETLLAQVPGDQRVAVVDAGFVGHLHALRLGLTDPRFPLAAIPGAVTAQPGGRQALTRAMARENSAGGGTALVVDSLADRIVTALDADDAGVHHPELGSLVAVVPADPQARNEARQAVAAVDDEAVRLKSAVKSRDGFFTTYCISPYSRYIARWCARRG